MKRLFFAFDVSAPWPEKFPPGRLLEEKNRHMTVAFLGEVAEGKLLPLLEEIPLPNFKLGSVGTFDQLIFLPPGEPRVAAYEITWKEDLTLLLDYIETLHFWLAEQGFKTKRHEKFLAHVTVARSPFSPSSWKKSFQKLPMMTGSLHLMESMGHSHYQSLWTYPLLFPFEEIEHTADVAYIVRGTNFSSLYDHGKMALCHTFPPLLPFLEERKNLTSINEVVIALNEIVTHADHGVGCPFKAVSFHDKVEEKEGLLEWEMIVDV